MQVVPTLQKQSEGVIQLPHLHRMRFGNALTMYLVASEFARLVGARLETSKWCGEDYFYLEECRCLTFPTTYVSRPHLFWNGAIHLLNYNSFPEQILERFVNRTTVARTFKWKIKTNHIPSIPCVVQFRDYQSEVGQEEKTWRPKVKLEQIIDEVRRFGFDDFAVSSDSPPHGNPYDPSIPFIDEFIKMAKAENLFCYPQSSFAQMAGLFGVGNVYMHPNPWIDLEHASYVKVPTERLEGRL